MDPRTKESDTQKTILEYLQVHRIFHWRNNTGGFSKTYKDKTYHVRFGTPGSPDIFAIHNGMTYGIEVKGPDGKQSPDQIAFQHAFEKSGGANVRYILARSLEDVLAVGSERSEAF